MGLGGEFVVLCGFDHTITLNWLVSSIYHRVYGVFSAVFHGLFAIQKHANPLVISHMAGWDIPCKWMFHWETIYTLDISSFWTFPVGMFDRWYTEYTDQS